jgi:hypothetical protein
MIFTIFHGNISKSRFQTAITPAGNGVLDTEVRRISQRRLRMAIISPHKSLPASHSHTHTCPCERAANKFSLRPYHQSRRAHFNSIQEAACVFRKSYRTFKLNFLPLRAMINRRDEETSTAQCAWEWESTRDPPGTTYSFRRDNYLTSLFGPNAGVLSATVDVTSLQNTPAAMGGWVVGTTARRTCALFTWACCA